MRLQALGSRHVILEGLENISLIGNDKADLIPLGYQQKEEFLEITLPSQPPLSQEAYVIRLSFKAAIP